MLPASSTASPASTTRAPARRRRLVPGRQARLRVRQAGYRLHEAIANTKGMMGLFSGHDHANSWCYKWDGELPGVAVKGNGINLCYGQHTGYGGYGDWIRGSREILVSLEKLEDLVIDSHIRTERGEIINTISLNATYGQDMYPPSPNDKTYL
ncbi:hypothetical protein NLG97_g9123 [Lecanicillium saksenae]|uniref:Uncharacterized protein n=1 Tax=Lecanicillium saksenae TaxID=468837 RepID=A0ACC1QJM1_9HYPO|nr:hypothetical protein NLG97_g9123 [Lecanicillium saksenae]